ncbi:MAG: hypothetical protein Q4D56_06285 [Bacteroides sp.]|nr:hypothetical protein [Bacteroides sp.]
MSQELAIIKQENIQTIVSAAPQSYADNQLSSERCIQAGQVILNAITSNGMTDELDQQAASYIEKARKTVKKMNERRNPVTKLFDDIRREFTSMENTIDPTKADTIPYKLQQLRNQYAAKKRAEEEERRRKELERQQLEQARARMNKDIEDDFTRQYQAHVNAENNRLTALDNAVTLANYEDLYNQVKNFPTALAPDFMAGLHTYIRIPAGISVDELRKAEESVKARLAGRFAEQFNFEVDSTRVYILDRLPSKKANLERMAAANEAEAARIAHEMEVRKLKEEAEREAERKRKEEEERQKAEMERQQAEMNSLFSQQATLQEYQPKVKVAKKIELLNPEGIMPIISMWWGKEGCKLSTDELAKQFKKQISFCEKLANKDGVFIEDESVNYVDDVKAK